MKDAHNLIIAVLLSVLVLVFWQYFYEGPRSAETARIVKAQKHEVELNASSDTSALPLGDDVLTRNQSIALTKEYRIPIITPNLRGSLMLRGARIDDLALTQYFIDQSDSKQEVVMFSPANSDQAYYAYFGWLTQQREVAMPGFATIWHSDDVVLKPDSPVHLTWDNGQGLIFQRKIEVDSQFMFTITDKVQNGMAEQIVIAPFGVVNKVHDTALQETNYILHEGAIGVFNGVLKEFDYKGLQNKDTVIIKNNTSGWMGISDKFWLAAIIPDQAWAFEANFRSYPVQNLTHYQSDFVGHAFALPTGQILELKQSLFVGAKRFSALEGYAKQNNIPVFDRAIDFGALYFLTKPIFIALKFLNSIFNNFGVAIVLLTIIIKIILFPLANASHVSMYKMRTMQPIIARLKEKFKDDRLRFNQELMILYRREKINPLSGCLPILVQIPVFFALYKVLFVTIEMRHAPFFGWIKDLSAADPTTIFNLFGLLQFTPPSFLMIGVWPLAMAITMYVQQWMNPAPTDPLQAKVMRLLPLMFILMFSHLPAGLIIYWTVNNLLSIMQQWYINMTMQRKAVRY